MTAGRLELSARPVGHSEQDGSVVFFSGAYSTCARLASMKSSWGSWGSRSAPSGGDAVAKRLRVINRRYDFLIHQGSTPKVRQARGMQRESASVSLAKLGVGLSAAVNRRFVVQRTACV